MENKKGETQIVLPKMSWVVIGFWLLMFLASLWFLKAFSSILLPFVVSVILAYLLNPVIAWLESKSVKRMYAILIVLGIVFFIVIGFLLWIIPILVGQIRFFVEDLPRVSQNLNDKANLLIEHLSRFLPLSQADLSLQEQIQGWLTKYSSTLWGVAQGILATVFGTGARIASFFTLIILAPVITIYLLLDWDKFVAAIRNSIPKAYREHTDRLFMDMNNVLSGFLRGQMLVCIILSIWFAISLTLAGLPYGALIGIIIGFVAFIPFLGTWIGVLLGLGTAIAQFDQMWRVIIVAAILILGQLVETNYLSPKLVGDRVNLHPVWMIFALFAAGTIAGFTGILLAVPVAGCVGVLVRFSVSRYKESGFYLGFNKES